MDRQVWRNLIDAFKGQDGNWLTSLLPVLVIRPHLDALGLINKQNTKYLVNFNSPCCKVRIIIIPIFIDEKTEVEKI